MPFINCKVERRLKWTTYCVLSAVGADDPNAGSINFTVKDTKLYVPAVTFSVKDNRKTIKIS